MERYRTPDWSSILLPTVNHAEKSVIREMFQRLRSGDIISFAGGMPDVSMFPYREIEAATDQIFSDHSHRVTAFNYGPTEGYMPLRQWIVGHMRSLGLILEPDNILITSGGQQALDLACRSMLRPRDSVIVAQPTYLGALQILRTYGARIVSVATDENGPLPKEFEAALCENVKFVYLVSDFSNPTGLSISSERRQLLIELARLKGIPIVDDAAYQQLRYAGDNISPMISIDQRITCDNDREPLENGGVIHIGTFSKTMMPGLRVGWMAAPKPYLNKLIPLKQATDLHSSLLNQMITYNVIKEIFDDHVAALCKAYGEKRDCMISAMHDNIPSQVEFTTPEGGMFVWVTLPKGSDAIKLLDLSMKQAKVAFIPGAPFYANAEDGMRYCRFSFSGVSNEEIFEGIKRLGELLTDVLSGSRRGEN